MATVPYQNGSSASVSERSDDTQASGYRSPPGTYARVLNSVLEDPTYTLAEFRVLLYLASKPPGWNIKPAQVAAALALSERWEIDPALAGLRRRGHVIGGQARFTNGRFGKGSSNVDRPTVLAPDTLSALTPVNSGNGSSPQLITATTETDVTVPPAETPSLPSSHRNVVLPHHGRTTSYVVMTDEPVTTEGSNHSEGLPDPIPGIVMDSRGTTAAPSPRDHVYEQELETLADLALELFGIDLTGSEWYPNGRKVAQYLRRTLTRSGSRIIENFDAYCRSAFTLSPAPWTELAVLAYDGSGWVRDEDAEPHLLAIAEDLAGCNGGPVRIRRCGRCGYPFGSIGHRQAH
jgi:hypothetical protein